MPRRRFIAPLFLGLYFVLHVPFSNASTQGQKSAVISAAQLTFDDSTSALEASDLDSGSREFSRQIGDMFAPLQSAYGDPGQLDDAQLKDLSRSLKKAIFYTNDMAYQPMLSSLKKTLEDRAMLSDSIRRDLVSSSLRLRDFELLTQLLTDDSSHFSTRYSDDWDGNKPSVIRTDADGNGIVVSNVDLGEFDAIVVYGPNCSPSKRALNALMESPDLSSFFKHKVLWLFPVDNRLHLQQLSMMTDMIPAQNVGIVYDVRRWPFIDSWSTPTFYVRGSDPAFSRAFQGWPSDLRLNELRQVLADKLRH